MTDVCLAQPFTPYPPSKLAYIVTKCCEHRPWFSDDEWAMPEAEKRAAVIARLSDHQTAIWEVWRTGEVVAIILLSGLVPGRDALFHGLAFDHKLKDKRDLVRNVLADAFRRYDLHAIRCEIPSYAHKLLSFVRNALGMRYESEGRALTWPRNAAPLTANEARLGSRRHHAIKHGGEWHDVLLLSVRADEFAAMKAHLDGQPVQAEHLSPASVGTGTPGPSAGSPS